jgi:S1-C subfamily serine protease
VVAVESLRLDGPNHPSAEVLILDIPLERGASGSPVYLGSGKVVGIVSRRRTASGRETVAIPSIEAIRLVDSLRIFPGSIR